MLRGQFVEPINTHNQSAASHKTNYRWHPQSRESKVCQVPHQRLGEPKQLAPLKVKMPEEIVGFTLDESTRLVRLMFAQKGSLAVSGVSGDKKDSRRKRRHDSASAVEKIEPVALNNVFGGALQSNVGVDEAWYRLTPLDKSLREDIQPAEVMCKEPAIRNLDPVDFDNHLSIRPVEQDTANLFAVALKDETTVWVDRRPRLIVRESGQIIDHFVHLAHAPTSTISTPASDSTSVA